MLSFDPQDPYPLLAPGQSDYRAEQVHAAAVDAWLGLRSGAIEAELQARAAVPDQQLWVGLPLQAMQTPYTELREIVARLAPQPGQIVMDLGAGYGRLGLVLARHAPGVRFAGYEYVAERVEEGNRIFAQCGVGPDIQLVRADLSDPAFAVDRADAYLIYDYGTRRAIAKTLEDLRLTGQGRTITVVGRGRAVRDAIERTQPWLSQVHPAEHHGRYSIYRS